MFLENRYLFSEFLIKDIEFGCMVHVINLVANVGFKISVLMING